VRIRGLSVIFLIVCLASNIGAQDDVYQAYDEEKPLYELGAGMFTIWVPDYPAANQSQNKTLPLRCWMCR